MEVILEEYSNYLTNLNYSNTTIELYLRDLKEFRKFLIGYDNLEFDDAKREHVLQYMYWINDQKNKSRTRKHKLNALKNFYKWREKLRHDNPTKTIESVKIAERLPKYLNLSDAEKLLEVFNSTNCRYYEKNNLIVNMFLSTGLRVSEMCSIRLCDIDTSNCEIKVHCKGGNQRVVYYPTKMQKRLKSYCDTYEPIIYLFEGNKGKKYSRRGMYQIVANAYKLAGLEGYSVHSLRHTVATMLYNETKDIMLVKEFLGHKSIESTLIYTHVNNEEVRNAVMRNPLNRRYK